MGLSCRQFARLAALRLDRPLKTSEALRFRMHSMMCGICRTLPKQLEHLQKLTRSARVHDVCKPDDSESSERLSNDAKERIRALSEKKS
ncbi:MAG: hypothetical protein ACI957_003495 [Verrucomicrobiales bacterium]|jgi:hypothetical protein